MNKEVKSVLVAFGALAGGVLATISIKKATDYLYNKSKFKKISDLNEKINKNNEEIAELFQQLKTVKTELAEVHTEFMKHFNEETGALDPKWKEWKIYSDKQNYLQMLENNISCMLTSKLTYKRTIEDINYLSNAEMIKAELANSDDDSAADKLRKIYGDDFVNKCLLNENSIQNKRPVNNVFDEQSKTKNK